MDRRSFFGFGAGALAAGPSVVTEMAKAAPVKGMASLGITIDKTPALDAALGEARDFASVLARVRPFQFGGHHDRHYVYRTGYPAIDALKSISGAHKALMEKRMDA